MVGDFSAALPELELERFVEQADSLPLGDRVALAEIAALCDEPTATAHGVALEAGRDEGFAALLLRAANSAFSMRVTRVSDLPSAVARIGLATVQALAIAAPALRLAEGPRDGLGGARRALHRHAVRTGLAARYLADPGPESERALSAGLLHNLGLSVISLADPRLFRALVDAGRSGRQLQAVEEELAGFTHAALGALVAERWNYPSALVLALRDHDAPEPATPLAALVQTADLLVRGAGFGVEPPRHPTRSVLALAGVPDPAAARAQLAPLLDAQGRLESHLEQDGAAHHAAWLPALDTLA